MRESRTPGSVGEVPGNRHLYPTAFTFIQTTFALFALARTRYLCLCVGTFATLAVGPHADVCLNRCNLARGHTDLCSNFVVSETILANIRVLAIDQAPKEKEGQNSVVGKTATLELKPEQVPLLAQARQAGTLSLALRSITDANRVEAAPDEGAQKQNSNVNVVRYGIANQATAQK